MGPLGGHGRGRDQCCVRVAGGARFQAGNTTLQCLLSASARVLPVLPAVAAVAWPLVVLTAGPQRFALLYKTRDATVDF